MHRKIAIFITFIVGILIIVSEFIPHWPFGHLSSTVETWVMIIAGFAMILGLLSLLKVNILKINYKSRDWKYSIITIVACIVMIISGLFWGTAGNDGFFGDGEFFTRNLGDKPFDYLFNNFYQHLAATMFSLLAFFIASAAYRAFIARSFEAKLLLFAAIIIMLGRTSLGSWLTGSIFPSDSIFHIPQLAQFIMKYPNIAGQRAIMVGAGLGLMGSSIRIILGIERSWLGGK